MSGDLSTDDVLEMFRAAGEPTRLRLLMMLQESELNVKDLTRILGQSQPRISRHLKLLSDAGLVERFHEGSWVYFRLADNGKSAQVIRKILLDLDPNDATFLRDQMRAQAVKQERADTAQEYFRNHVAEWDHIRSLYVPERMVEIAMLEALGQGPFQQFVDLGTGTGRILELFADCIVRGIGIDINHDMLSYARSKIDKAGLVHCQVRHGDLFNLSFEDATADVVIFHQVLHFLSDPILAIYEAQRILKPKGKLLIVDFASHDLEFLRAEYAHQRLGFEQSQMKSWIEASGLSFTHHQDLKPDINNGSDKLTVSLWLARKEDHYKVAAGAQSKQREYRDETTRSMQSC